MLICHLLFANKLFLESAYKVQTTQTTSKIVGDNARITNNASFAPRWVGAINQTTFNPFILAKHVQKRLGPPWQILMCTVEIWVENNSHFQKLNSPSHFHLKGTLKELFLASNKDWLDCLWNPRGGENQPLQTMTPMFKDQGNPSLKIWKLFGSHSKKWEIPKP